MVRIERRIWPHTRKPWPRVELNFLALLLFLPTWRYAICQDRLTTAQLLDSRWFIEQGVHGREEAVELMAEYLEGLYGPHAFKYFGDANDVLNSEATASGAGEARTGASTLGAFGWRFQNMYVNEKEGCEILCGEHSFMIFWRVIYICIVLHGCVVFFVVSCSVGWVSGLLVRWLIRWSVLFFIFNLFVCRVLNSSWYDLKMVRKNKSEKEVSTMSGLW